MNSSIGATSVRRLIAVVRSTNSKCGPVYSRRVLLRNLFFLCVSHFLLTACFLPFLALQSSVSVWNLPIQNSVVLININIGSLLLSILCLFASVFTLFGPPIVQKLGSNLTFLLSYVVFCIFYAAHLYPTLYILIPVYVLLGLVLGPVSIARINVLMTISSKLSYVFAEEDEEARILRRTTAIRRVARAFQAAQDFGLIFGSILSAILITYTINMNTGYETYGNVTFARENSSVSAVNASCANCTNCETANCTNCVETNTGCNGSAQNFQLLNVYDYSAFLDEIFDVDEFGDRLCGSQACPSTFALTFNASNENYFHVLPKTTATILTSVYLAISAIALLISALGLDRIRMYVYQDPLERPEGLAALRAVRESFKDVRLQLAAPLAVFIGMEQAFMYTDFSKVRCPKTNEFPIVIIFCFSRTLFVLWGFTDLTWCFCVWDYFSP